MITNIILGSLITLAFATIFNAPKRTLLPIMFLGAVGIMIKKSMLSFEYSIEFATFTSAFCIGVLTIFISQRQNVPILIYTICSSIVLVPTIYAYKAMIGFIQIATYKVIEQQLVLQSLQYTLKTWLIFGAIVIGLIIPTQFVEKYRFRV